MNGQTAKIIKERMERNHGRRSNSKPPFGFIFGIVVGIFGSVVWTLHTQVTIPAALQNDYGWEPASTESTALAYRESMGFFTDVPDSVWKRYKERFRFTQPNYDQQRVKKDARKSNRFWGEHFEPEFTCPHEFRLGKLGDGGKWVCDPHRIPKDSCLIYSVGSNGKFQFELGSLEHISKSCEIRIFDMSASFRRNRKTHSIAKEAKKHNLTFHHWGIGEKEDRGRPMKTFKETIIDLHHQNKTIDVMKIDCERCEYQQYKQWFKDWDELGMTIRQILIEIHNSDYPNIVELMTAFQEAGYVMFHKEANYWNEGNCIEAAFLLLSKDFQKESPAIQG